jgi:hypothetical protein
LQQSLIEMQVGFVLPSLCPRLAWTVPTTLSDNSLDQSTGGA